MKNKINMKTESLIVGGMALVTLVTGAILSSVGVSAETDVVDEINITVPSACTMSGNIATGQEHTASVNPNTYQDNIGKTTITTYCNDAGGYAIYAIGFTGDKYTGEDQTKLIGANTDQKIATGTAKTGTSQWAMRITSVTGTYAPTIENDFDSADYHVVPDTYAKVATYGNTTDAEGGTGSSIETTYAAYISGTQAADTYTGKVKYTLVHPNTEVPAGPQITQSGKICYYPNGVNVVGTMGCQTVSNSATSITLIASNFSREGYGFAGWSNKFDYTTNTDEDLKFYGPNEDIAFTRGQYTGTNNGLSLYAVWVKSEGNLQDSSKVTDICSNLTTASTDGTANLSSISALTDTRDNDTYAIARLADGNCWMIENLRLDNTTELTIANTNNPLNNGTTVTLKHNYTDTDTYNTLSPTSNVAYNADTAPDGWCYTYSGACYNQSRLRTDNTVNRVTYTSGQTMSARDTRLYSYGNYYNWYSATAGRGTYNKSGGNTTGDLCPAGWHIPTGDNSGEFNSLNTVINSGATNTSVGLRRYPSNFIFSGVVQSNQLDARGVIGRYNSSTAADSINVYTLNFYGDGSFSDSYIEPARPLQKCFGYTIRCVSSISQ